MTAKAIRGQGIAHTPGAAAAGTGFRGLILTKTDIDSWQTLGSSDQAAVTYDGVFRDTAGFVSAGSNVFGAHTVPAGSAGVVPVGMAGDYEVSSSTAIGSDPPDTTWFYTVTQLVLNNFENSWPGGGNWKTDGVSTIAIGSQWPVSPVVMTLAEGDVIWQIVGEHSAINGLIVFTASWLMMRYLG